MTWAYRTETDIRFAKLDQRDRNVNTTLQSPYLLDIYSSPSSSCSSPDSFDSQLERDRYVFDNHKLIPTLRHAKDVDGTLKPIQMVNYQREDARSRLSRKHAVYDGKTLLPPDLLSFEIILEAYLGYSVRGLLNADDVMMPRGAIMGGVIVAALCSWDQKTQRILREQKWHDWFDGNKRDGDFTDESKQQYLHAKRNVVKALHERFLYQNNVLEEEVSDSDSYDSSAYKYGYYEPYYRRIDNRDPIRPFSKGDVDIFLQVSPQTRSLLTETLNPGLADHMNTFVGGVGVAQPELLRFSKQIVDRVESPYIKKDVGKCVFALTKHSLSFQMTIDLYFEDFAGEFPDSLMWPRVTQLIMLNPCADLVGALFDFDLSTVTCAYDGTTVRLTPRAAFSLQTLSCVVTPYTLAEQRNKKRIVKYFQRGFDPFVIDPWCSPQSEGKNFSSVISRVALEGDGAVVYRYGRPLHQGGKYLFSHRRGRRREVDQAQEDDEPQVVLGHRDFPYSLALIEENDGDALEFFSKYYDLDEEDMAQVLSVPSELRQCGRRQRRLYAAYLFLKGEAPIDTDNPDDLLFGDKLLKMWKLPSFCGGGMFESSRVRSTAWPTLRAVNALKSQSKAEEIRYAVAHGGSIIGYQQRFTHGKHLEQVFANAEKLTFPDSSRPPVGLNPE